jgi:hypothetical protein
MEKCTKIIVGVLALIVGMAPLTVADSGTPSKEEIAKEMANPNTALISLKLQTQYFSFDGDLPAADDQDMVKLSLQPTLPFPLENGKTVWVRPGVPYVFDQPIYDISSRQLGSKSGLGDITLDVQYGTTLENGFLWSLEFSAIFPTASDKLGSEVWALGPGFQIGRISEKLILGVFANHQWDIAGDATSSPERPYLRRDDLDEADISLTATSSSVCSSPAEGGPSEARRSSPTTTNWSSGQSPCTSRWERPSSLVVGPGSSHWT